MLKDKIRNYTLGEAQDICNRRKGNCKLGEDKCRFVNENSMCKLRSMVGPSKFDLTDSPLFTDDQLAIMREFHKHGYRFLVRDDDGNIRFHGSRPSKNIDGQWLSIGFSGNCKIPFVMFPQIESDDCICLYDCISVGDKNEAT